MKKVFVVVMTILAFIGEVLTAYFICEYAMLAFIGFIVCWIWSTLFLISNLNFLLNGLEKFDKWCYNVSTKIKKLIKSINNFKKGE